MVELVKKAVGGFVLGLGFAVAGVAVLYLATEPLIDNAYQAAYAETQEYTANIMQEYSGRSTDREKPKPESALKIIEHRERKTEFGVDILGAVENSDEAKWSGISIEVELFDADGQFVDECSDYLSGDLAPNARQNFKVKCGGCKDSPLPEYSTYTIRIANAHASY